MDGIWNEKFNFCEQNHGVNKKQNKTRNAEITKAKSQKKILRIENWKMSILTQDLIKTIFFQEKIKMGGKK